MLVYEKKVLEVEELKRHLFGTLEKVPAEADNQLVYTDEEGTVIEDLVENDIYLDDKHHGIIRKSDGKNIYVYIKGVDSETGEELMVNIIPGTEFQPVPPVPPMEEKLQWTVPPIKVDYIAGEVLDLAGGIVDYIDAEGNATNVTLNCVFDPEESSVVEEGTTEVIASYNGLTAIQSITVEAAPIAEVTTPEELAAALEAGGNVKIAADMETQVVISADKVVNLDLGGHTISNNTTPIVNNGNLIITDTSNGGKIISTGKNAVQVNAGSALVIEAGNFEAQEYAIASVDATGASITINGGTFTTVDNCVIGDNGNARDGEANIITINDGEFNGNITSSGYIACGIYAPWKDLVTINGGKFNINNGVGICARAGQITINNGTFNCTGEGTGKVGDSANQVPAGTAMFFDTEASYPAHEETDFIRAKGGIYSSSPIIDYVAEGYEVVETSEGAFEVKPKVTSKKRSRK